jgi:hypothetical protein
VLAVDDPLHEADDGDHAELGNLRIGGPRVFIEPPPHEEKRKEEEKGVARGVPGRIRRS